MLLDSSLPSKRMIVHHLVAPSYELTNLLSKREIECVNYLIRGMTAKQIGTIMDLSHRTVEFYLKRIKNKLTCRTKSELIAKVLNHYS